MLSSGAKKSLVDSVPNEVVGTAVKVKMRFTSGVKRNCLSLRTTGIKMNGTG